MKVLPKSAKYLYSPLMIALLLTSTPAVQAKDAFGEEHQVYAQRNLVSDLNNAEHTDPNLVNAWGLAFNPTGVVWVGDNGTGVSTLYDGEGVPVSLVAAIPSPTDAKGGGNPTGVVFNPSAGFVVSNASTSGSSRFIFATEDGLIAGWAPNVDLTHSLPAIDNSGADGAVYKGLTLISGAFLYATDFRHNKVDVFDSNFKPVKLPANAFVDQNLPAGYAAFGIQAINNEIFVTYAKQDAAKHDDVKGKGFGFINVFDPNGQLIRRLASADKLNAPWGVALAPAGFGKFSGKLLVGNFGDGRINAYDLNSGGFVGQLRGADHKPITIDGLWGISFGNGFKNQPVNTLFFAAGPDDEAHGLYGRIDTVIDKDNDDWKYNW
ncbi:TIGR03118 family protein [Methylomonas sp. AM2-LC]|uniref:TIGR03118 family protein n=1 Tax=Methylomonas sp. AM2-LC TaxID=3153301 RepID=UPI00326649A0